MQVEVQWENGVFRPLRPLELKQSRITITVPDEAIETNGQVSIEPEIEKAAQHLLQQFAEIRNAPMPDEDDLPEWREKNQERLEAIELHRQRKQEQGRGR